MFDRITFTYGGIAIDAKGHALTPDKSRIPGLLVAGAMLVDSAILDTPGVFLSRLRQVSGRLERLHASWDCRSLAYPMPMFGMGRINQFNGVFDLVPLQFASRSWPWRDSF